MINGVHPERPDLQCLPSIPGLSHCHWPHISRTTQQSAEGVPEAARGMPENEPQEVSAVQEGDKIPGPHHFDIRGNHGTQKAGSCEKLAKTN